jgi:hypothetical protein
MLSAPSRNFDSNQCSVLKNKKRVFQKRFLCYEKASFKIALKSITDHGWSSPNEETSEPFQNDISLVENADCLFVTTHNLHILLTNSTSKFGY